MKFRLVESINDYYQRATHIITTKYTSEQLSKIHDILTDSVIGYFDNKGGDIAMWASTFNDVYSGDSIPEEDVLVIAAIYGYDIYYNNAVGYYGPPDYAIFSAKSTYDDVKQWMYEAEVFNRGELDEVTKTFEYMSNDDIVQDYVDKIDDSAEDVTID